MSTRTRERVRDRSRIDRDTVRDDNEDQANELSVKEDFPEAVDDDVNNVELNESRDERDAVIPAWLVGMRPISWSAEVCQKTEPRGRNCCLFYPLGYCRGLDVINGFCIFHLKAAFNLVYQTDYNYRIDDRGKAVIVERAHCFVADPQHMDDRVTATFPIFEMFESEPSHDELRLHNLSRYIKGVGMQNWESVYGVHVNFLHNLITLRTYVPRNQTDQMVNSQMLLHWNTWNEYHSWLLARYPIKSRIFYSSNGADVRTIDVSACTAVTQMIVRLFSEPYTSLDEKRFYSTVANYGFHVRGHLSYIDNLCSSGTTYVDRNARCIGNLATLPFVRTDKTRRSTLHYTREKRCEDNFCVASKVNLNAPALKRTTATVCSVAAGR